MEGETTRGCRVGAGGISALGCGLALTLVGCSWLPPTTATSFLQTAEHADDPNARYVAYERLASPRAYDDDAQKAAAARLLSKKLDEGKEPLASRAVICRTLGAIGNPVSRPSLLKAVSDPEPMIRAEACRALGSVGKAEDAATLARVMSIDTSPDCRIAAIEGIGRMRTSDSRVLGILVNGMEVDDPAIRLASYEALKSVTGRDLGPDSSAWRSSLTARTATDPDPNPEPANGEPRRE